MLKRLWIVVALAALTLPAHSALAGLLPSKIGYTIFARGKQVGHSDITVKETADALILDSTTKVDFGTGQFDLTCHTEADKRTFLVRRVEWRGNKGDAAMSGNLTCEGDSLHGTSVIGDTEKSDYVISPYGLTLVLEDYVMDHEVLIARAHMVDGQKTGEYGMMFPSALALTSCRVDTASKAEIESDDAAVICDKILVAISGSDPFASFYDPRRGLPVYLVFPQTNVEVFLDDFFGSTPVSRYREKPANGE